LTPQIRAVTFGKTRTKMKRTYHSTIFEGSLGQDKTGDEATAPFLVISLLRLLFNLFPFIDHGFLLEISGFNRYGHRFIVST
jgi:hypothetical protein